MHKIPLIIDADTGIDDAFSIGVACYVKKIDLKLLSSACGNVDVNITSKNNANLLLNLNKQNIEVSKGSGKNYSRKTLNFSAHGENGLGGYCFKKQSNQKHFPSSVERIHEILNASNEKTTILLLGPHSNMAELIEKYPTDIEKIDKIVISGGLIENLRPNEEPYYSFNIARDSVATEMILNSGIKIEIIPSNLGHEAFLTWKEVYKLKNLNQTGKMYEEMFRNYTDRHVKSGVATHDLCAFLYVVNPKIFNVCEVESTLNYENKENIGVLKFNFKSKKPNSIIATEINVKKCKKIIYKILKKMP